MSGPWFRIGLCILTLAGCTSTGQVAERAADGPEVLVMFRDTVQAHFRPDGVGGGYGAPDQRARVLSRAKALAGRHGLSLQADWPMPSLGVHCVLVHAPSNRDVEDVISTLEHEPGVAWAQTVQEFHVLGTQDPYYRLQAGAREMRLESLHKVATGRDVVVAQLDTGVDVAHPDLSGRVAETGNFIDGEDWRAERHGTAVAGIIAAASGNDVGIVGVAPEARLLALRTCRESGTGALCTTFSLAKGMEFAIQRHARVVNLSLTGPRDRLLGALIDRMVLDGTIVVAAVDRTRSDGGFPAAHPGVVAVASSPVAMSAKPVLVAPGRDVLTALPAAQWGYVSGNSFAAAHVSGLAALFSQRLPRMDGSRFVAYFPEPSRAAADSCATLSAATGASACRPPP
ncbi:MAG: S8 family serine peptidase [Betaproteobacteria bacterium]|nr:S8 family serine peptidase [Betaproteobacteria bacterium]